MHTYIHTQLYSVCVCMLYMHIYRYRCIYLGLGLRISRSSLLGISLPSSALILYTLRFDTPKNILKFAKNMLLFSSFLNSAVKIRLLFLIKNMTFDCYALGKNTKAQRIKLNYNIVASEQETQRFWFAEDRLRRGQSSHAVWSLFAHLVDNLSS